MILHVKDVTVHYWKVAAVRNVTMEIERGKIITLIGSNGAGKSTILKTISGLKSPTSGRYYLKIEELTDYLLKILLGQGLAMFPKGGDSFLI